MPKPPKANATKFELPEERLASTTETGKRLYIHPAKVSGKFKTWRNWIHTGFILFFLILPWTKINGHQTVLLDIAKRKFSIFGITFWAHDAPMLVLVLLAFVLSMGLITALFGRIWCGWACPQTVFIESVYRRIEDWIEGSAHQREKLDAAPFSLSKLAKRSLKWTVFIGVSLIITHSFLAYFVGSDALLTMIRHSPSQHPGPFIMIVISTAIIAFDFGWFREQFCIIACPYGRMQSVLMDDQSLVVAYDAKRGEPRKQNRHDTTATGDCINCYRCVQVCPTGIDIRRGVQLECIMCTACIDACDTVMTKIQKPTGLIRYDSEVGLAGKKIHWFRPRVLIYTTLLTLVVAALIGILAIRSEINVTVIRPKEMPYQLLPDNTLLNHFKFIVRNQSFHDVQAHVELDLTDPKVSTGIRFVSPVSEFTIASGRSHTHDVFIQIPMERYMHRYTDTNIDRNTNRPHISIPIPIRVTITDPTGKTQQSHHLVELIGPIQSSGSSDTPTIPLSPTQ